MKLKRISLVPILLSLLLVSACNKKEDKVYSPVISGVNLRGVDATPMGEEGKPDVHTEDPQFSLVGYPNPSINVLNLAVSNLKPATHIRFRLVSAIYETPPAIAVVENRWQPGAVLLNQSFPLPQSANNRFSLEVSNLPRGFYRLYAETDDGGSYWDNIWLMK